jgi:hypothetical protein
MGFATYDDLISEITTGGKRIPRLFQQNATTAPVAANWYSMLPVGGIPGSHTFPANSLAYQTLTDASTGVLTHGGNVSTDTKHILNLMAMASAGSPPPVVMVVDIGGYYGPFTQSISAQTFTGTPQTRYDTLGGWQMCLINSGTAMGATASNITTLTYVDQGGASSTIPTTPSVAVTASTVAPTATLGARVITSIAGPFIPLAAGDTGVRSVTNITFSAANTGNMALLLVRTLATIPCPTANVPAERDLVMQLASLPRVFDGAALSFLVYFPAATGATITGNLDFGWG